MAYANPRSLFLCPLFPCPLVGNPDHAGANGSPTMNATLTWFLSIRKRLSKNLRDGKWNRSFMMPAAPGAIPAVAAQRLHAQNGQGDPEYGNADEADRKAQSQV